MGFKLGICGAGAFAGCFIPLFQAHPLVAEVALADLVPERRREVAAAHGIRRTFASHAELCASDVDAVAIFAQRHLHGPLAIQALRAGKHVYCAVPMASDLDDMREIVDLVGRTRLTYMTGETSFYYPAVIHCRERFRAGAFGHFVYGEGNYLHDMSHGFYASFQRSGGADWRRAAGFPPMFYPTHSVAAVLAVTGARATSVSCLGWADRADDGVFRDGDNLWSNRFSNQTALMRTSDGGMMRINEFRRVGWWGASSSNPLSIYGTAGSFEQNCGSQWWTSLEAGPPRDLSRELACARHHDGSPADAGRHGTSWPFAQVHPRHRLPESFARLPNGHLGSHQFLVDDFARAVATGRLPPNHAWAAARSCVPGLVAHRSSLEEGALLPIPDLGSPPADWRGLDEEVAARAGDGGVPAR